MSTFFRPPFSYLLQWVICFNLGFPFFQINCFCVFSNGAITLGGTWLTKARCTNFDIAKVLKTKILHSIVSYRILDSFSNLLVFMIHFLYFSWFSSCLLHEKCIRSILIVLGFRFTHSIPQSAIWTPFRTSIPVISHLDIFSFNPEKIEKCQKICITSVRKFSLLRKEVLSSA